MNFTTLLVASNSNDFTSWSFSRWTKRASLRGRFEALIRGKELLIVGTRRAKMLGILANMLAEGVLLLLLNLSTDQMMQRWNNAFAVLQFAPCYYLHSVGCPESAAGCRCAEHVWSTLLLINNRPPICCRLYPFIWTPTTSCSRQKVSVWIITP